jgi:hypothetical protein
MGFDAYKGRGVVDGQQVELYRNLHNKRISVRDAKTKLVLGHADEVMLTGAQFLVSEAGRQRVLREDRKNVHAVVRGTLVLPFGRASDGFAAPVRVTYNPHKYSSFVLASGLNPITAAEKVIVSAREGVLVDGERRVYLTPAA